MCTTTDLCTCVLWQRPRAIKVMFGCPWAKLLGPPEGVLLARKVGKNLLSRCLCFHMVSPHLEDVQLSCLAAHNLEIACACLCVWERPVIRSNVNLVWVTEWWALSFYSGPRQVLTRLRSHTHTQFRQFPLRGGRRDKMRHNESV